MKKYIFVIFSMTIICAVIITAPAQKKLKKKADNSHVISYDTSFYAQPIWRCIGPFRGGRSAAVTGVPGEENLYYFGSTGGGVWRTEDGGNTWTNISDGFFGGSIGAVAVSASGPNVIYAGEGGVTVRGNVSSGNGIRKSEDAGIVAIETD